MKGNEEKTHMVSHLILGLEVEVVLHFWRPASQGQIRFLEVGASGNAGILALIDEELHET